MPLDLRRWPQADRLIEEALALEPAARPAFVEAQTAGNHELRAAIEAVLFEDESPDSFLEPGGLLHGALAADLAGDVERTGELPLLAPGTRLGGYEVLELAGRGGMGEVYKARDIRLGRLVALKILPDRFANDPERLARFEREARVLASLNHPRIGSIHGLAEQGDVRALVLEWVDGPTLAERLAGGPLPVRDTLAVAIQVGEALEAAHQRAIVHRDLKPANIKLTAAGVRVLDFGLAKAAGPDETADGGSISTLHARPGFVLGTPSYMSPEQARGERVDHRADIWAFGCILAEMLTGRRAFAGSSSAAILKRLVEGAPDIARLPASLPPAVRTVIERCLEKDPRRRLGWIGEAVVALEDASSPLPQRPPLARLRQGWWRMWPAAAGLAIGVLAALTAIPVFDTPAAPAVSRLAVPHVAGDELVAGDLPTVALSRDGRQIVYRARRGGTMQLFRRALERGEPEPIPGSEHAIAPFLSPDGNWVGFSRDGALVKAPIAGGTPVVLCEIAGAVVAVWLPDDAIVFGGELTGGLLRVAASGGTAEPFTTLDASRDERVHTDPDLWEGNQHLSFTIRSRDRSEIALVSLDGRDRRIIAEGSQARFVAPHHMAFVRQGALWAAPLDLRRLALAGSPGPVPETIDTSAVSGTAHYAVSATGTLVYLPRRTEASRERLVVWVDRNGNERPVPLDPRPFTRAAVSPDGGRIALAASGTDSRDLWLYSGDRGTLTRITFDDAVDTAPVWTPDGGRLIFRSDRDGGGLFVVGADAAGAPRRLTTTTDTIHTPYDVTRDSQHVLFTEFQTYRLQRIGMVPLDGGGAVRWLVDGPFAQLRPRLSPDGRWIAYQSDESGRFEVYVRPFPATEAGRWQVSTSGGVSPTWGPDGRELFYFQDGGLIRVPVSAEATFGSGSPTHLFAIDVPSDRLGPAYDVAPDGRHFLFIRAPREAGGAGPLMLVENWHEELKRQFPPD